MLDCLHINARPDERFHLQLGQPIYLIKNYWWGRKVIWSNIFLADGSAGKWETTWFKFNFLFIYSGTVKCDGTRTFMFQNNQLCLDFIGIRSEHYVMTTTPKEMFSVRFFHDSQKEPTWNNMGGS